MKLQKFPVNPLVCLVFLLCLSLLAGLGAWQFNRAGYKTGIEAIVAQSESITIALEKKAQDWKKLVYRNVAARGTWSGEVFLLDNRILDNRPGYEVLAPMELAQDRSVVLVNLGWLDKVNEESVFEITLPDVSGSTVEGMLYRPLKGFTLGPPSQDGAGWPRVIQYIDFEYLSGIVGPIEPVVIVTADNQELGTTKIWKPYVIDARRHYGYAVQWWGLATVLAIFGVIWYKRSRSDDT